MPWIITVKPWIKTSCNSYYHCPMWQQTWKRSQLLAKVQRSNVPACPWLPFACCVLRVLCQCVSMASRLVGTLSMGCLKSRSFQWKWQTFCCPIKEGGIQQCFNSTGNSWNSTKALVCYRFPIPRFIPVRRSKIDAKPGHPSAPTSATMALYAHFLIGSWRNTVCLLHFAKKRLKDLKMTQR